MLRAVSLVFLGCETVFAFPSFRDLVPNGRRVPCPEDGQECQPGDPSQCEAELACGGLGHRTCRGGTLPLNVFGLALQDAGFAWSQELCEADSDGDGLTNGEELGDPCCLWVKGSAPSLYTKTFAPLHPGVADSSTTVAAYSRPSCSETGPIVTGQRFGEFNTNEEQRTVEIRIKSHNVPAQRTSYINFLINIPDSAWEGADTFYVVKADAIIDKKEVLHHYVINACSKKVPEHLDGVVTSVTTARGYDCTKSFGGWAPGAYIMNLPPWVSVPFGPKAGIVALDVQIHYDNPREASDIWDASGMRFWYTPTPREYPMSSFVTMQVSYNEQIVVPPKKSRWFLTRTCTIDIKDDDCELNGRFHYVHDGQLYEMDIKRDEADMVLVTAVTANSFSTASGVYTPKRGWGEFSLDFDNGTTADFYASCDETGTQVYWKEFDWPAWIMNKSSEPVKMHLFGVSYHAHLLGVQMYTEYFPMGNGDPVDVGSEHVWYFDDQYTRDMLALNLTLTSGDKLQSTCVMNSMHLEEATIFGEETIDEMCWAKYSGWSSVPGHTAIVTCEGPVWQGELLEGEPGFGLAERRPVEKATASWDGSNRLTGGAPLHVPKTVCIDEGFFCQQLVGGILAVSGADVCAKDLSTFPALSDRVQLHGKTLTQVCCATACANQVCHTTPSCLTVKEKEKELQAQESADASDSIVLSSDPFYSIRTMGCSSDAGMLKKVAIQLPDELLTDSARAQLAVRETTASDHVAAGATGGDDTPPVSSTRIVCLVSSFVLSLLA